MKKRVKLHHVFVGRKRVKCFRGRKRVNFLLGLKGLMKDIIMSLVGGKRVEMFYRKERG